MSDPIEKMVQGFQRAARHPIAIVNTATLALVVGHGAIVGALTERSLPEGATKIGWKVTGPGHMGLAYQTAAGRYCIRSGVLDSCAIQDALTPTPPKGVGLEA